jgi:hypothetical protein
MKKLISLVKASAEKNKQEVVKMIELDKEEEYLKTMSKKNQKYKKKLEKFYEKKTKMMKNQSARDRGEEEREKVKITDMTNAEEPMNLEETGISTSRLKTYNL